MDAAALDPAPCADLQVDQDPGKALDIRQRLPDFLGRFSPFRYVPTEFRAVPSELGRSGGQSGEDLRGRHSERLAVPGDHDGGLLAAPRRSRVTLRRSEAVPRRSFRAWPRSAVIVCRSAGVPPEGVRRRREAAQLSACSSLLWDPAILKAGAAGAALCPVITLWSPRSTSVGSVSVSV